MPCPADPKALADRDLSVNIVRGDAAVVEATRSEIEADHTSGGTWPRDAAVLGGGALTL